MSDHLTEQDLIGYVTQSLTDAQREGMNRHLASCPACRTRLDDHESLQRRIGRELAADLKVARPAADRRFASIAGQLPAGRRRARLGYVSLRLATGAIGLFVFAILGWFVMQNFAPLPSSLFSASPLGVEWDDFSAFEAGLVPAEQGAINNLSDAPIYHVELVINEAMNGYSGRQAINYTNRASRPMTDLYLYLLPNRYGRAISLDQVRADGQTIRPAAEGDGTVVRLPLARPLQPGGEIVVEMAFSGRIPTTPDPDSAFFYQDGFLSLAYPFPLLAVYDNGWQTPAIPAFVEAVYSEAAWYLVRVSLPKGQTVVASGVEVARQEDSSGQTLTFAAGPARGFYLGSSDRFTVQSQTVGRTAVRSYVLPGQEAAAEAQLEQAQMVLAMLDGKIGPYPYTELELVAAPIRAIRGRAYPGVGFIAQERYETAGFDATLNRSQAILLEGATYSVIAQQWFGNVVGNDPVGEPFLGESLSENLVAVAGGDTYGLVHVRPFWEIRSQPLTVPLEQSLDGRTAQEAEGIVYGWGPHFFDSLAFNMGLDSPLAFWQHYYQTYQWQIATMADLRQLAEQKCGCDLTIIFEKYLTENR